MPYDVNGLGTTYSGRSVAIYWEKPEFVSDVRPAYDTMYSLSVFYLPIVPLRPCHVFDWTGNTCREVRLKWSWKHVFRTFARNYLIAGTVGGLFLFGLFLAVRLSISTPVKPNANLYLFLMAMPLVLCGGLLLWVRSDESRERNIRLLMGPYEMGSSDPAMWHAQVLEAAQKTATAKGSSDWITESRAELAAGRFAEAMFAARMAVALGECVGGEALTDEILRDLRVLEFLEFVQREPWRRGEWFSRQTGSQAPAPSEANGAEALILFYDNRCYSAAQLDAAGGPGFSDFVAAHPVLQKSARTHAVVLGAIGLFMLAGVIGSWMEYMENPASFDVQTLLGFIVFVVALANFMYEGWGKEVRLGGGRIWVGRSRGQAALLDAVTEVGRRRWLGFFLVVAATTVGGEIAWPAHSAQPDEIERAIKAAIKLRAQFGLLGEQSKILNPKSKID